MLASILVHSAVITISETGWLINHRNLFLIVLEAGKSKMKVVRNSVWQGAASWFVVDCVLASDILHKE